MMTIGHFKPSAYFPILFVLVLVGYALATLLGYFIGTLLNTLIELVLWKNLSGLAALGMPYLFALLFGIGAAVLIMRASIRHRGSFQGGHALLSFVLIFGTIISVNLIMANHALSTFSGLVVKNSYIASQSFDARREAQMALGWEAYASYEPGALRVTFEDEAGLVYPAELNAVIGRPTNRRTDIALDLYQTRGGYAAELDGLDPGRWRLHLRALSEEGTVFEQFVPIDVR